MKYIISFSAFLLLFGSLTAQYDPETGANLTPGDVQHFIKHYPSLVKEFKEMDVKFNEKNKTFDFSDALMQNQEVLNVLSEHGYNDANEFVLKTAAIALSYASIRLKEEVSMNSPEIQQALREIENSPDLTPEQKEQYKQQMMSTIESVEASGKQLASEEDIKVVEPFVDQLTEVLEEAE